MIESIDKFWRDEPGRYCLFETQPGSYAVIDLQSGGPVLIEDDAVFHCMVDELLESGARVITDVQELIRAGAVAGSNKLGD